MLEEGVFVQFWQNELFARKAKRFCGSLDHSFCSAAPAIVSLGQMILRKIFSPKSSLERPEEDLDGSGAGSGPVAEEIDQDSYQSNQSREYSYWKNEIASGQEALRRGIQAYRCCGSK